MVVEIDYTKCLGAEKCGKCLKICPLGVFTNMPTGKYNPKKPPEDYQIKPSFKEICNKCEACVKVCPKGCIIL